MALEEKIIGTRVFMIDRQNNLLFTKSELKVARVRFEKELAKAISRGEV